MNEMSQWSDIDGNVSNYKALSSRATDSREQNIPEKNSNSSSRLIDNYQAVKESNAFVGRWMKTITTLSAL